MENPNLTFLSSSLLAGDRSLTKYAARIVPTIVLSLLWLHRVLVDHWPRVLLDHVFCIAASETVAY